MQEKTTLPELLAKYKAGTLSEAERALLENFITRHTDPEYEISGEAIEKDLAAIAAHLPLYQKTRSLWPRVAAAASILLCCSIGLYLYKHPHQRPAAASSLAKNDIAPGHNQATLILANGHKIILTKGLSGKIAMQHHTVISAGQNMITYKAGSTADRTLYNTLSTARGEQSPYPLVLADGTKVWLNAESSITFPTVFNGKERIVKLTGEAYFEVMHNDKQPFKVETANQTIQDIGTHFDVNAYPGEAGTTTLLEGSVKVNELVLQPGEQSDGKTVKTVNASQFVAWKDGDFDFENDDIQTVMRQLSRWYTIDVSYQGNSNAELFNAQISRKQNISVILNALQRTNGVRFKIEGRRVTVIE